MITLRQLLFPFSATVESVYGEVWYTASGYTRLMRPGQRISVAPLAGVALAMQAGSSARIEISHETAATDVGERPLTQRLAQDVFHKPGYDWSRQRFASRIGLPLRVLARRLFAEGSSFRQTVRTYQLSRLFCDLPDLGEIGPDAVQQYGFLGRHLLEDAIFEHYGLALAQLHGMLRHHRLPCDTLWIDTHTKIERRPT